MHARLYLISQVVLTSLAAICAWQPTSLAQVSPTKYLSDVWTTEKGLPQNSVTSILQSRDGYLWVGTFGGLARFDGVNFTIFDTANSPGLKSNRIIALLEDHQGVIWIGTEQGGLSRYDHGAFTTYTTNDGLPDNHTNSMAEDAQGRLWIATSNGVAQLADGRFTRYTTRDGLADNRVILTCAGRDNSVWLVSARGLTRWRDGGLNSFILPDKTDFTLARSMFEGPDGSIWIAGQRTFARFRDGTFTFYPPRPGHPALASVSIFKGSSGGLRFLMSDAPRDFVDGEAINHPTLSAWAGTKAIIEDREGNLWIGSSNDGLFRFKAAQVTAYTSENGLADDEFLVIAGDGADGLWAADQNLFHYQNGAFKQFTHFETRPGNTGFWALLEDRHGTIWTGSYEGLHEFKDARNRATYKLNNNNGLTGYPLTAIYEDRAGQLWIGSGSDSALGGLHLFKDGVFTPFRAAQGLTLTDVRLITEDRQGALWIGGVSGMSCYKDGKFTNYTTEQGLSNNYVRDIYEDADGTFWIGTYGGGLNRFKDGRFTPITTREGLFDNIVSRILEDDNGNLWMSCNRGIFRASRKELNELADGRLKTITCVAYGVADGMKSNETNGGCQPAGWKDRAGNLWFPTIKGVVMIDPNNLNRLPPPVVVEQVLVDKAPVDVRQKITMRPGQRDLEIHYAGLSLTAPEKVRFKYQLVGYDRDWVDVKERRVAYYTNVTPGTYTFRVMATNNDGVWSTHDASIQLTVIPPFWRTWWFSAWTALVIAGMIFGIYKRRIRQLERAGRAREEFSKQLIESQEGERKRIAGELHDSLSQNLVVIKNRAWLSLQEPDNHENVLEQMEEIADAAEQSLAEVREIAYNLRPFQIDRLGLTSAIESLVAKVDSSELRFESELDSIDKLLLPEMEINLYRIVQESINNIIKHSSATKARIKIRRTQGSIEVLIEDNGRGFDTSASRAGESSIGSGFGLIGITERARILGGTPIIKSAPGEGTTINISIETERQKGRRGERE
jgi:signal transduction histidine kinase/ligand-binding sensor domain-containing protein